MSDTREFVGENLEDLFLPPRSFRMRRLTLFHPAFFFGLLAIVATLWFRTLQVQAREVGWLENRLFNVENDPQIMWREPNMRDWNEPDTGLSL